MHLTLAEVPAAAPALVEAVPPLLLLTGLLVALGIVVTLRGFVSGLLNALASISSWIPFVGSITAGVLHKAEQSISSALGTAISKIEGAVAHQFHNLARVVSHLWRTILSAAELIFALAVLAGATVTLPILHSITRPIMRAIHALKVLVQRAETDIRALEKQVAQGIPRHLAARLHAVEHAIAQTIPREIKTARDLANEALDSIARLWSRVKTLENSISDTAIAAAVATAVAALGLDWLTCKDGARRAGRAGCGLWDDLGSLFGLFVDTFLLTNVCEIVPVLESAVSEVADPIVVGLTEVGAGLCSGGIGAAPPLHPPALSLPANPGFTLHIP